MVARKHLCPRTRDRLVTSAHHDNSSPSPLTPHEMCDYLSAAILAGESSRDAILKLASTMPISPEFRESCLQHLQSPHTLSSAILAIRDDLSRGELREFGVLLALCLSDETLVSAALQHASEQLRSTALLRQHVVTHTAHARMTTRVLTALPVGFLGIGVAVSTSLRNTMFSPITLISLVLATCLHASGWLWVKRLISRVWKSDNEQELYNLVMALCVSLHTGHTVTSACLRLNAVNDCGQEISQRLTVHPSLDVALEPLAHHFGNNGDALRRVIVDCAVSGLPLKDSATRIALSMRHQRATAITTRIQQLGTQLSIPLVLCMLPAFALAVLIPLLVASAGSLVSPS